MKTLAYAGIASVLAMASGTAAAAVDSNILTGAKQPVDLSFSTADALTGIVEGAKGKMRGHKMRGYRGGGHKMRRHGGYRKGHHGNRGFRGRSTGGFFFGGFPSYGFGGSTYYAPQRTYVQQQPVYYPVPYPVHAPTTVVVQSGGHHTAHHAKGKTLTKPGAHVQKHISHHPVMYDHQVLSADDHVIASSQPVHPGGTTYQGEWDGAYQQDGSYQGNWQGVYRDAEGRAYEGQYSGTFIGEGGAVPTGTSYPGGPQMAAPAPDPRWSAEQEELAYLEQCKRSSGIGGALVGGAIGAFAGNRIAGRGNRLGGSLIGGGLGALAGAAIERGTDRCRKLLKKYGYDREIETRGHHGRQPHHGYRQQHGHHQGYQQHHGQQYHHGWHGGYYHYPQPAVTTIVIQSQPVTTTTTTTVVEEEYVYSKPKYVAKKQYKPKWKPAPKKGCQQARCGYDY